MKVERRTFKAELRKDGDSRQIKGTAIIFNSLSENLGGFRERISPDALAGCDMADVVCLVNHDENRVLGRTVSETLALSIGADGVQFSCDVPDTSYARDLATCMDRGDISQCSFSWFTVAPGGAAWTDDKEAGTIRTVNKISRLFDVSVVTTPAYRQTSSEIRSNAEILSERATASHSDTSTEGGIDMQLVNCRMVQAVNQI